MAKSNNFKDKAFSLRALYYIRAFTSEKRQEMLTISQSGKKNNNV